MLIDINRALDALDEAIGWKLRPALDPDELFDSISAELHRLLPELTVSQIDLRLADLRRRHVHAMQVAEHQLSDGFRTVIGAD
jgi:hypothetical protein